jgi:hypothetical protein
VVGEFARRPPTYRSECLFNKNFPYCEFVHFQNWGAALFTVFVKGAGFSSRNHPRTKEGRIGIGQREERMAAQKTRTLEQRKGAAPKVQERSKRGHPRELIKDWSLGLANLSIPRIGVPHSSRFL